MICKGKIDATDVGGERIYMQSVYAQDLFYLCRWSENKEREMRRNKGHHQVIVHRLEWGRLLFLLSLSVSQPLDVTFCVLASLLLGHPHPFVPNHIVKCKFPTSTNKCDSIFLPRWADKFVWGWTRAGLWMTRAEIWCAVQLDLVLIYLLSYFC